MTRRASVDLQGQIFLRPDETIDSISVVLEVFYLDYENEF